MRWLIAIACLWTSAAGAADWVRVRGANTLNTGNSLTITAVTSGDIIIGGGMITAPSKVSSVTDNQGNPYDLIAQNDDVVTGGSFTVFGFKSRGLITNGPTSITVTYNGSPANVWLAADEFTPPTGATAISLDGTTAFVNLQSGALPTGMVAGQSSPFSNVHNDDLIYSWNVCSGGTWGVGAGFTAAISNVPNVQFTQWKIDNANTLQKALWNTTCTTNYGYAVAIAPVAATTLVPVQWAYNYSSSSVTTISTTLPKPVTPGNFLILGAFGNALSTVSDNLGGNYLTNIICNGATTGSFHYLLWSGGTMSTAPQTFTSTQSASNQEVLTVVEVALPSGASGVAVDASSCVNHTTPAVTSLGVSVTTTAPNDFFYSWISSTNVVGDTPSTGTNLMQNWNTKNSDGYQIPTSAGVATATWQFPSNAAIVMHGAAFKALTSSGSPPPMFGASGIFAGRSIGSPDGAH